MSGTGIPQPPTAASDGAAPDGAAPDGTPPDGPVPPNTAQRAARATGLRTLKPLDPPMLPFALGGVAVWLIALLVILPFRSSHESWFWICVAGLLWGIPGVVTMIRYDARRKRNRDQPWP